MFDRRPIELRRLTVVTVMAAGHGGQVLVSQSTRDLLNDQTSLRDLGEHRLKDLSLPQRLDELQVEGLPQEFPALKTMDEAW